MERREPLIDGGRLLSWAGVSASDMIVDEASA
jgi:hypothetical protein